MGLRAEALHRRREVCMGSEAVPPILLVLDGNSGQLMETMSFTYMLNQHPQKMTPFY